MRVAVASKDGLAVNEHFGWAKEFLIYEVTEENHRFLERRSTEIFCKGPEVCEDQPMAPVASMLSDCQFLLCSMIGWEAASRLGQGGIKPVMVQDFIDSALTRLAQGELKPVAWVE